jgi:molybdate transport system substrate-binding protein
MKATTHIRALTMLAFLGAATFADAAEIRVYCTGAPSQAVKAIAADFSARTGHHLTFIVGQPATIEGDLTAGDKADIIVVPSPLIARLARSGAVRADSALDLARVGIGIVVRAGMPQPDISSFAAIRKLLLDAHSIAYPDPQSGGGFAGRAIERIIEQMGITDAVKSKLTLAHAISGGVDLVADGKADIGLFNISEILPVKGVTMVGPLPPDLQSYIVFGAAIPVSNSGPEPAAAFVRMLADPVMRQTWQHAGLEPLAAVP